jgi:hypothetical protein
MYKILAAALVMAAGLAIYSTAQAVGGCGWGYHRGPHGGCRVNRSDAPAPRPAVVVAGPRTVIYAPLGRACPVGHHLGPHGRRCWPN